MDNNANARSRSSDAALEQLVSHGSCTGCAACVNACATHALNMIEDDDGFVVPHKEDALCSHCDKCVKVCPQLNYSNKNNSDPLCYGFRAEDAIRGGSSSGGFFPVIAKIILEEKGIVCGAAFDQNMILRHRMAEAWEEIQPMRGSKYIQSHIDFIYIKIRNLLNQGRIVLFTGTPCQVAGLNNFLGKNYDNLLTVDLICHGVPSQNIFNKYLREVMRQGNIENISFRDKRYGWGLNIIRVDNNHGGFYEGSMKNDWYIKSYLSDLIMRKCCSDCKFCDFPRAGDLTMGDFWQYERYIPDAIDNKGTSLVFINNNNGNKYFNKINHSGKFIRMINCDITKIPNRLRAKSGPHRARNRFFKLIRERGFGESADYCINNKYDIGMLGWYHCDNFGSSLTNLALYHVLDEMGYSVLMIDNPQSPYDPYSAMHKYYNVSPYPAHDLAPIMPSKNAMKEFNKRCDTFLTGSDQMFNYFCYRCTEGYVSQDWVNDNKRKVAYAASFGHDKIFSTEEERAEMSYFMKKFDAFSVREKSGVHIAASEFGVEAAQVPDPVFICDPEFFRQIALRADLQNQSNARYVFGYILDGTTEKQKLLEDVCLRLGLNYLLYTDFVKKSDFYLDLTFNKIDRRLHDLIMSDYVVTDSFHGTCFAIIFRKPFIVYANKMRGCTRFESILSDAGLMERMVYSYVEYMDKRELLFKPINYERVYERLTPMIEFGKSWLQNALNNPEEKKSYSDHDILQIRLHEQAQHFKKLLKHVEDQFLRKISGLERLFLSTLMELDPEYIDQNDFQSYINQLSRDRNKITILITVMDTPCGLDAYGKVCKLQELGLKQNLEANFRKSYVAAIDRGNVLEEKLSNEFEKVEYSARLGINEISIVSISYESGNSASVMVNGIECISPGRGINMVILDAETHKIRDSVNFDTYLAYSPAKREFLRPFISAF